MRVVLTCYRVHHGITALTNRIDKKVVGRILVIYTHLIKIQNVFHTKIIIPDLTIKSAFIGFDDTSNINHILINHILLIFKIYVYSNRNANVLNFHAFIQKVISVENLERFSIDNNKRKSVFHANKWSVIYPLINSAPLIN